ncbi:MAG: sulfatase [Deltaproteobacteria bacterium]|nr:sulfatase [Deltaproteobacteria bacterium]MBW2634951.1 sulfatase [Deltaproteobacteria bacterium]
MIPKNDIKNVIFIMTDSLQRDYLTVYGNQWMKTPNYERFAKQATVFDNNFTEGLPTVPCRRAMMTGRYTLPFVGWSPLRPEDTTVSDILWGTGIQTSLVYDTGPMRLPKYGYSRGFEYTKFIHGQELDNHFLGDACHLNPDDYLEEESMKGIEPHIIESMKHEMKGILANRQEWRSQDDHQVAKVTLAAANYLENEVDPKKPFFLWVDSFDPHEPYDPPSVWDYNDDDCPYNPGYEGKDQFEQIPGMAEGRFTEPQLKHIRSLYAEKITLVDKYIGKLLDKIKNLGLWDNTLIILTSDHGKPHGLYEHGHGLMRMVRPWPYVEMAHTPLIIRYPGYGEGERVKSYTQSCDMAPTILDMFGMLNVEGKKTSGFDIQSSCNTEDIQGVSLLPLIRGDEDAKARDFAISGYYGYAWTIFNDDYSYIHWLRECESDDEMFEILYDGFGSADGVHAETRQSEDMWTCTPHTKVEIPEADMLFDRNKDQYQLNNIIKEQPKVGEKMLKKLKLFMGELRTS